MKNEKITEAWDKMKPSEEIKQEILNEITQKHQKRSKLQIFKPTKIIATAAAIALIVGLFNIQTVIAFVGGLFFAPGAGITRNVDITYYGLEAPIDIETEYGTLTLKFATKVTKNDETVLGLHLYSQDISAPRAREDYPLYISITADGENIVSDEKVEGGGYWGSDGTNQVTYDYVCSNFPDVNEFDLTLLGVETHISLINHPDNFALSEEKNGITLAASKFGGVNDMLAMDVFDSSDSANDYNVWGNMYFDSSYYDENGNKINKAGFFGGYDPNSPLNYQILEFYENEIPIKLITGRILRIHYDRKEPLAVKIPVPKDGETIQTDIEIPIGSHTFRITEVRREGDIIYYENNCHEIMVKKSHSDMNIGSFTTEGIPYSWTNEKGYFQAIKNNESFIEHIFISHEGDWDINKSKMGGGEIWDFDEDAESLTFYFTGAIIIQFGDFNVEFK